MTAQLRSELLKWSTTRTLIVLLLVAIGLTLLVACVEVLSHNVHKLAQEEEQRTIFSTAGGVVVLFAALAGLISVTSEFRHGTIRPTVLFKPRRRVFLAAKLAAAAKDLRFAKGAHPRAVDPPRATTGAPATLLSMLAGYADVLAGSPIRGNLQAHLVGRSPGGVGAGGDALIADARDAKEERRPGLSDPLAMQK
jgi:hypothetical protein